VPHPRGVLVRMPCALPPGCRLECRDGDVVIPMNIRVMLNVEAGVVYVELCCSLELCCRLNSVDP
jgi:hypothetical protein